MGGGGGDEERRGEIDLAGGKAEGAEGAGGGTPQEFPI